MINNPEQFSMIAKTYFGFEQVLAEELKNLGAAEVETGNRYVSFEGDLGFLYKANYSLGTALRILKPIFKFEAFDEKALYKKLSSVHWENYLDLNQTFVIDSTASSDRFTHSQFIGLKCKDAIADYFREKYGERPSVDKTNPDIRFDLYVNDTDFTLSIDSSGESLHKRGYRKSQHKAPISEVLAHGLLKMAGWQGKGNLLDPMCGSGTFLIEAFMIAAQVPPQLHRKRFSFQNWKDYDEELFEGIKSSRLSKIKDFDWKIVGYDKDPESVEKAIKNIESADFSEFIEVKHQDFFESEKDLFPVLLVFNPPYDERLASDNDTMFRQIGDTLKHNYPDTLAYFVTSDIEAHKKIGLRPSRKIQVFNGKLECKFYRFEMYQGSLKAKKNLPK